MVTAPGDPCTVGEQQHQCGVTAVSPATGSLTFLTDGASATYKISKSTAGTVSGKIECKYGLKCSTGVPSGTTGTISASITCGVASVSSTAVGTAPASETLKDLDEWTTLTAGDWCPTVTTPHNPCTAGE